jgi:D-galactarolactone cycloisomerase
LQLAAALPSVDLVEFIGGSPYVDGITQEPFVPDDEGYLTIAATPDGVARNRDKLKQFTADPSPLFAG